MTNKEAKEKLYMEWQKFLEDNIDYAGISDAYKTAFKALEQEPILDKIRDEIEGKYRVILKGTPKDDWAVRWNDCLDEVLQVIDKYKAESEVEE